MRASLLALLLGLSAAAQAATPVIPSNDVAGLMKVRTLRHITFETLQACASFNEPNTLPALERYGTIWMARHASLARRLDLLFMGLPPELTNAYERAWRQIWKVGDSAIDTLSQMNQQDRAAACRMVVNRLLPISADPEAQFREHRTTMERVMAISDTQIQVLGQQMDSDETVRKVIFNLLP